MVKLTQRAQICKTLDFAEAWGAVGQLAAVLQQASDEGLRLDQVERQLFAKLLDLGRVFLESHVKSAGEGDVGETYDHSEHGTLHRSESKHTKPYQSIFGEISISRWIYHVREGQKALHIPLDQQLGVPKQKQSYVLEDWLQRLVVKGPYEQAVKSLDDLLGLKTSVRSAERMNRDLAKYVGSLEEQMVPPPKSSEGEILVVTADGKGVPMRRSLNQRKHEELGEKLYETQSTVGYQKTQKRRTAGANKSRKQTAYVGAIYSVAPFIRNVDDVVDEMARKKCTPKRPRPQNKRLYAELTQIKDGQLDEGPQRLFAKLAKDSRIRGRGKLSKPVICLMDGQRSLWFRQKEYMPNAITILDIFHVMEYLWEAAYCHHPQGSVAAEKYVTKYLRQLLQGKVGNVIRTFGRQTTSLPKNKKSEMAKVINYLRTNRQHMRYDEYLKKGYPIGSGVVEGACRHLVKDRMELSGMRWQIEGAQDVLSLRTTYINKNWEELIEHRIQSEQQALYSLVA